MMRENFTSDDWNVTQKGIDFKIFILIDGIWIKLVAINYHLWLIAFFWVLLSINL